MESYAIHNLTFTYPNRDKPALRDINLTIERGQFVTLCGKSGCGKSTLLRHLKTTLTPYGKCSGEILFEGTVLNSLDMRAQSSKIGFVLQNPDNQIVTDKVWHELAFGLESLGYSSPEIRARVAEMASFFGIETWFHQSVNELSGGQKQLLNLASIMVLSPSVLILDEPTSQLDPIAAQDFLETISKINRELGTTVILTEHRLEDAFPMSDRVIVIDDGRVISDGSPLDVGMDLKRKHHHMAEALPTPMRVYAHVKSDMPCPITVRDGRNWLNALSENTQINGDLIPVATKTHSERTVIELRELWFRYEKNSPDIVKGLSERIYENELYAIVGGNGTGKTTSLSLINGLLTPYRGEIVIAEKYKGATASLPQNPQALFVKNTVRKDLYEVFADKKIPQSEKDKMILDVSALCALDELLDHHPYDLSGGEMQRAALAKVLLLRPKILLLDEPTKGLDAHFKETLAHILKGLQKSGVTIIMVSHDIEFCARHADRCAMFFDGNIVSSDEPRTFFSGKSFYTTAANRMARSLLPSAILAEDIIATCGGEQIDEHDDSTFFSTDTFLSEPVSESNTFFVSPVIKKRTLSRRTICAIIMVLLAIPLTIYIGTYYLGDRKYYFISILIILETLLPFMLVFEHRKPQARELVIISVLCAIAVAGRSAFFMLPQFKPVVALVIISGVCFGGETGFLVGAISAFASNMLLGQGPWTPWQMFAFGVIGLLAGVLFKKGFLRKNKPSLCIFGGLTTFFIYGGIMDTASILMFQAKPTTAMFLSSYLTGVPFNLIHAAATIFFLWIISKPMIEKLDRIKEKYGLIDR